MANGNITPYYSEVPDQTGIPDARASGNDFGAQVGAALAGLGDAGQRLALAYKEKQDKSAQVDGSLALAQARQAATQHLIQEENGPNAGSAGFTDHFNSFFDDLQAKATDSLPSNDHVRKAFAVGMAEMRTELSDRAMQSQATQGAQLLTTKAQSVLSTYVNTIQTDPTQYDKAVAAGNASIDGLGLQPADAEKLKQVFDTSAVAGRFDALFRAAKTPAAVQGIIDDLSKGPWKNQMSDAGFHELLTLAHTTQNSVQTLVNTQAEAAVTGVEDRIKGGAAIEPQEMGDISAQVKQSNSPVLLDKWARLKVQADTTQRVKGLSTTALTSYKQANTAGESASAPMNAMPNSPTGRAQDGFAYLKSKYGLDDTQAMGVLSNIGRETGFQPRPGDGGTSDGYFQWHLDRMTAAGKAGALGTDIRKAIDFAMSEPQGMAYLLLAKQGQLRDLPTASKAWLDVFEKPKYPERDQPVNEQWARRLTQAINGGRPLTSAGPGAEPTTAPTEFQWIRAKTAEDVLQRRDSQISGGDQITAGQDANLFKLGELNSAADFQVRAQQSQVATGFLSAKENKPFTPNEVAAFTQIMQQGTLDQKMGLLQNVASMGAGASDAFKQIGEKSPVLGHIGGLSTVSPTVASDVMRGVQAMQENPDLKTGLEGSTSGPGTGGTASVFAGIVGQGLGLLPKDGYAARQAADALYVQRAGPGAAWNADTYAQAARDVLGAKPGDTSGGVATVNGQATIMPPGVNGDDFQTMLHMLQPEDLVQHSVGGGPPTDVQGRPIAASDFASEGQFKAIGKGAYNVYLADGKPALGTDSQGLYTFRIDAPGVKSILSRGPAAPGAVGSALGRIASPPVDASGQDAVGRTLDAVKNLFPDNFFRTPSGAEFNNALSLKVPRQ